MRLMLLSLLLTIASSAVAQAAPAQAEASRVVALDTNGLWAVDPQNHVWISRKGSPVPIEMWDGQKWIPQPFSPGISASKIFSILADKEGRIWVMTGSIEIFDTRNHEWHHFNELGDAYLALRSDPPHFAPAQYYTYEPDYCADGKRMAYRDGATVLYYYDGTEWQRFYRYQITGGGGGSTIDPPWFDKGGKLCLNLDNLTTWQMDDAGKWSIVPFQHHFPDDVRILGEAKMPPIVPPPICGVNYPGSAVVDNLGSYWLLRKEGLFRSTSDICLKLFGSDEGDPVHSSHVLRHVFVDSSGTAFLQTNYDTPDHFMIPSESPPPQPRMSIEPTGVDSFAVQFASDSKFPVTFQWELDGGPWQFTKETVVQLQHLANGQHSLKAIAVYSQINREPSPPVLSFEVKIDPNRQIGLLIAQLSDPDFDRRKEAVKALAQQPGLAQPALQSARATATEDQRWWIDVALQEIADHKPAPQGIPDDQSKP